MEKRKFEIIDPFYLIYAYSNGFFPMADSRDGPIHWYSPDPRAVFFIKDIKIPRTVRQLMRRKVFEIRFDYSFERTILECAKREDTWISDTIINSYINLHHLGYAHSVEAYQNEEFAGGLYGVALGAIFFGESMVSKVSNSSKVAFFHLVEHLRNRNFILIDSQFINPHTARLGAIEIPRETYLQILKSAIEMKDVHF
ncbi:MAG: leucyl/phenylalanyl-tRNA--protein transferase [Candidatus Kapaibacteriales bacterium]